MVTSSKSKKPPNPKQDIDLLKSDVASFASSIGLSSSFQSSSSGFNDSDFRKTGRIKPSHPTKQTKPSQNQQQKQNLKNSNSNDDINRQRRQPKSKTEYLSLATGKYKNNVNNAGRQPKPGIEFASVAIDKYKSPPKLPLAKASSLGVWYVDAAELEEKVLGNGDKRKLEFKNVKEWKSLVEKKKALGENLLAQYTLDYELSRGQSGDVKMLMATQRSGTASDKVSAFSVLVGENPIANVRSLDALLGMVASKLGKRHALTGFEALKELFISSLLPDRKLKTLFQRPLNHLPESKDGYSLLLFWYWEECLKQRYEHFVSALEEASKDVLAVLKDKALKTIYVLLKSKSELERRLLSALVNKLGDPESKAASNADFHLSKLLSDHPNMKVVVIDEVDNFLFRPHLVLRAKYHAVNFLSQIRLSHKGDGPKVAKRLIDVYFALFKVLISEADGGHKMDKHSNEDSKSSVASKDNKIKSSSESHVEMDSRLLSALLTGVNRAFPFVSSNEADDFIEVQTQMLFQLVHSKNFNVGVQALMLLDKISSKNQVVSDRFYRALYSKLLLPAAMNSSKEEMLIGLLLRAMKNDINLKRVAAFSKRLLQIALQQPPQYACGCLFLLSEVLKARPPLWSLVLQNESVDEDIEHFEDVVEENDNQASPNLVKSSSEIPDNADEVAGNEDDVSTDSDSSLDEGGSAISNSEDDASDTEDDLFTGVGSDGVQESKARSAQNEIKNEIKALNLRSFPGGYNPRHREPSYCNADCVSWWELMVLASHVHPSVATMAKTLLSGANIVYNGNPLNDLSLTAFLDKFMEKKPKQSTWHGGSQIEPAKKLDMSHQLIGAEILSLAEMDVPPEDLVFHKFYTNKISSSKKPKKKKKKKGDEAAEELFGVDGDDESDNEEIENILDSTNPDLVVDGNYDYDDLDQVANEEDADLVGNLDDKEMGMDVLSDISEEDVEDVNTSESDDGKDNIKIGDIDDGSDFDGDDIEIGDIDDSDRDKIDLKKRKQKKGKRKNKAMASPFASIEDYEHLLNEENPTDDSAIQGKKHMSRKRRKISEENILASSS